MWGLIVAGVLALMICFAVWCCLRINKDENLYYEGVKNMKTMTIPKTTEYTDYSALKDPALPIGTIATIDFKSGKSVPFILVEKNVYGATNVFVNADGNICDELPMYETPTYGVCYAESDRVEQLKKLLEQFPDELRDMMIEREITQIVDGKKSGVVARLWTPSTTEIFGVGKNPCDVDDVHFSYFSTEKSRIIESDRRGTWFYSLRSPTPTGSTGFDTCSNGGNLNSNSASNANCVRCGFLL